MKQDDDIVDPLGWTGDEVQALWNELDRLRLIARNEGWEDEFVENVREWADADGTYPVDWLKLRRHMWYVPPRKNIPR